MADSRKAPKEFNAFDYLFSIYRRRYFFLAIFIIVVSGTIIFSYLSKKKYSSSALILFEQEKVVNPLERQYQDRAKAEKLAEKLKTIRQIILSRSKLLRVVQKLDLDLNLKTPLELENYIDDLRQAIEISMVSESLYRISYEGDDPQLVKDLVNTMCTLFIEEHLEKLRGTANDAFTFIGSQLEVYKKKLEDSENALRLFKQANLGQLPGEENINISGLTKYQSLLTETEFELKEATLKKSLIEKQLSLEQQHIVAFSSLESKDSLEVQLIYLEREMASFMTRYTEKYPEVIKIKSQIEEVKKQIAENANRKEKNTSSGSSDFSMGGAKTEVLNPIYQKLREELNGILIKINSLQAKIKDYQIKIDDLKTKVESIPKQEQELVRLNRDYDGNAAIYNTLLSKLEEARISRELELKEKSINFQIIDPAQLPLVPSKPNRPMLILLGLALGLGAGFLILFIPYYLDKSIAGLDDAKNYFRLPILAGIPLITIPDELDEKRKKDVAFYYVVGAFLAFVLMILIREVVCKYPSLFAPGIDSIKASYHSTVQVIGRVKNIF